MRRSAALFLLIFLFFVPMSAGIACAEERGERPSGHHGADHEPRASFQVEAVREVANDWATARMTVQAEGKQAAEVAAEVNRAMKQAMERAKRASGVEVRSGGYSTSPVYDDGQVVRWRARQVLVLESGDPDGLSRLIGELQSESLLLSGIDFSVRRETRQALEDELIGEALSRFRRRAKLVAEGLGAEQWSVDEVEVGTTSPPVFQRERVMAFKSATAPSFSPGTSEIRVTASGTVRLD